MIDESSKEITFENNALTFYDKVLYSKSNGSVYLVPPKRALIKHNLLDKKIKKIIFIYEE